MAATLTDTIRIAVSQQDSLVGDIAGNLERVRKARASAAADGATSAAGKGMSEEKTTPSAGSDDEWDDIFGE